MRNQVHGRLLFLALEREWDPHVVLIARRASGTSLGEGIERPVPTRQDDPGMHWRDAAGRIRTRALFSDLRRFHVKPAHSPPGSARHTCPFSPAVHVVTIGFAVLPQCTALDQHLPKQPYLPHSSISAQRLPSHRTRRTRRPTSSIHIAAASGSSSRATAHDGSTSGKESPSVHQRHPAT